MTKLLRLRLLTPIVRAGERITVLVEGRNAPKITVGLNPPDTVFIPQPQQHILGPGTFSELLSWTLEHAQAPAMLEINTEPIPQTAVCKIVVD